MSRIMSHARRRMISAYRLEGGETVAVNGQPRPVFIAWPIHDARAVTVMFGEREDDLTESIVDFAHQFEIVVSPNGDAPAQTDDRSYPYDAAFSTEALPVSAEPLAAPIVADTR